MNNKQRDNILASAGTSLGESFLQITSAGKSLTASDINTVVKAAIANAIINGADDQDPRVLERNEKLFKGRWQKK